MRKRRFFNNAEEYSPMDSVANLFDISMVFVVALMVALVVRFNMEEIFSQEDYTLVKNPGTEQMEIITKKGEKIERYKQSETTESTGRKGKKVGVAYQMESGEIIYIPE